MNKGTMRVVKVRAWDMSINDWVEGVTLTIHTSGSVLGIPHHIVLTWSTGFKDKNGKDIFEGDFVKADWHWDTPHEIIWPHDYYDFTEYSLESANLEVIGNIFENPELVE